MLSTVNARGNVCPMTTPDLEIASRLKGSSFRKLAAELDIDQAYLHRVWSLKTPASKRLLDALGLERITKVTYRRKARTNGAKG